MPKPVSWTMPEVWTDERDEQGQDTASLAAGVTRRRFLAGVGSFAVGLGLYANQVSRHELDITHRTIRIRDLPEAFHGFRIAQISDLHLNEFTEEYFLRRVVRHVNALATDLVLVTGDFVSAGPKSFAFSLRAAVRCGEILHDLTCPLRFGCLGNHDATIGSPRIIERIAPSGLSILVNQRFPIERNNQRLWIAALDDPAHGAPDVGTTVPARRDGPLLLMVHEPDYAAEVLRDSRSPNIDLILSGHSHGGQVCLPGGYPLTLPPGAETFYEGLYRLDTMQLYVNRGIGTVGIPFRFNCSPELSVLTLQPA